MNDVAISEFFQNTEEVLRLIFDSIRTENLLHLNSAESLIIKASNLLKNRPLPPNECNETVEKDLEGRANKITTNLSQSINIFKNKISKHIFLSEKAVGELEYLIGTVKHLSRCLMDIATTRNTALTKYIIDTANTLENTAINFALEHKERLANGICRPQSAAVFIDLLNNIKDNSYHFKEMGRRISYFLPRSENKPGK
jgi:hypothetical protein